MKKNLIKLPVVFCCCSIVLLSCKKDPVIPPGYNQPNASCILIRSQEDLFGNDFQFTYNAAGQITHALGGTILYDTKGRLSKAVYPIVTAQYKYKDATFLPSEYIYTRPGTTDSVHQQYEYNLNGQIAKLTYYAKTIAGIFNYTLTYTSNASGDITRIMKSGATTPVYEGITFDTKLNYFQSNQWLKLLLINSGAEPFDFLFYNRHNATKWKTTDNGDVYVYDVTYTYNAKGFATKAVTTGTHNGMPEFERVETNDYNCDQN